MPDSGSDLDFRVGAGDGNRTRTISLGICAIRASTGLDLRGGLSVSDRKRPLLTGVNGPLMARRPRGPTCRPSAFQAGHIPRWRGSSERYALLVVAADSGWLLLLLSPLLSAAGPVPVSSFSRLMTA